MLLLLFIQSSGTSYVDSKCCWVCYFNLDFSFNLVMIIEFTCLRCVCMFIHNLKYLQKVEVRLGRSSVIIAVRHCKFSLQI